MKWPRWILFDYGETLFSEIPYGWETGNEAILRRAVRNPYGITAAEYTRRESELWDAITSKDPDAYFEYDYPAILRYLSEYYELEYDETPQELEEIMWDASSPGMPFPHVAEMLEWLWEKGIRTGVISNLCFTETTLRRRIENGLPEHHFEFLISTREYGVRKPSRLIFELALRKAGISPQDAWFCGNDSICDVEGAHALGMYPVWFTGGRCSEQPPRCPHTVIRDWNELPCLLETCLGEGPAHGEV